LALETVFLLEGILSSHAFVVAVSLEIPTKKQIRHFFKLCRKVPTWKTATSHLSIKLHRSQLLLWILEAFSLFHSCLQSNVNSQSQRNTASCLNPKKKRIDYSNTWEF